MKASIGRIVVVAGIESNGSKEQAAIITRAWSDKDTAEGKVCVNLAVFPDCPSASQGCVALGVITRGSVDLYDSRAAAEAAKEAAGSSYWSPVYAFWPDRHA